MSLLLIYERKNVMSIYEKIKNAVSVKEAAELYGLNRGKIAKGYEADLVIFDNEATFVVKNEDQKSKCGWTPYEGETLRGEIKAVYIDGNKII